MHSTWTVRQECPQCGAPVTRAETDRVLQCGFCRVRLVITSDGPLRYLLPPRRPGDQDLLYLPYWRLRGMAFSCGDTEMHHRVVDTTIAAAADGLAPPTLGMRPQAMPLQPVTPQTTVRFAVPRICLADLLEAPGSWQRIARPMVSGPVRFHEFIGETFSVIYTPVQWRGPELVDAVLDRVVTRRAPEHSQPEIDCEAAPPGQVRFLPTLCPHCGQDMEAGPDSCVLLCSTCERVWEVTAAGLRECAFEGAPAAGDGIVQIPFWRISAAVDGIALQSVADLVRFANLPRVSGPDDDRPLQFWLPAFKIQPKLYVRLVRQVTGAQPRIGGQPGLPGSRRYPVTLPAAEAAEAIRIAVAQLARDKRAVATGLASAGVQVRTHTLVYLPFRAGPHDLVCSDPPLSINRAALDFGRKL